MAYNTIQAVIIHCKGDVKDLHRPRYQVTQVTPAHPVFNEAVCEVSALVGMAAKLIRVNTPESETVGYRQNGRGTFLKLQLDPTRRQFGFAPFSVPGRVGTVIQYYLERELPKEECVQKHITPEAFAMFTEETISRGQDQSRME